MVGCRVLTRPPSISGAPVSSATSMWAMPASARAAEVPPLEISSQPRSESPRASSTRPGLVVDGQQCPHGATSVGDPGPSPAVAANPSMNRADGVGVERALHRLDALVQGRLGVAGEHRHRGLGQHRAGVHLQGGDVDGGPRLGPRRRPGRRPPRASRGRPGSRAGWVLRMRPGKAAWMGWPRTVPNPAMTTTSIPSVHAARR